MFVYSSFIVVYFYNDKKIPVHSNATKKGANENECRCNVQAAYGEVITGDKCDECYDIFLNETFML